MPRSPECRGSSPGSDGVQRHRRLQRLIDAWIDAETTAAQDALVTDHLRRCRGCAAVVETTLLLKRALARRSAGGPAELATARLRRFAGELGRW